MKSKRITSELYEKKWPSLNGVKFWYVVIYAMLIKSLHSKKYSYKMHSITVQNIIIYTVADEIQKVSHPSYTLIKQISSKGRNKRVK